MSYQELTAGSPLTGQVPEQAPRNARRLRRSKISRFGWKLWISSPAVHAMWLTCACRACCEGTLQPPFQGARLVQVNDETARQIPGVVKIVHEGDFAARG